MHAKRVLEETPFTWTYDTAYRQETFWNDMTSSDDVWAWINGPFLGLVAPSTDATCAYGRCINEKKWSLFGSIRMRQVRSQAPSCNLVSRRQENPFSGASRSHR